MLNKIFEKYILEFPEEENLFNIVREQFKKQTDTELKSRKNFVGHFTAAAFLVCKNTKRVLLLEHKILKKMIQPGGHIEETDINPLDSAYRELNEETGIGPDLVQYRCISPGNPLIPFDIDTHFIPENSKKVEASHYHHDMRYLFTVEQESLVDIDKSESNLYEWTDWQLFADQTQFKKVAKKIELLIADCSAGHFFEKVHKNYSTTKIANIRCIIIQHILPNSYAYILYLQAIFQGNLVVFAKPKSIDHRVMSDLYNHGVIVKIANRENDTPAKYYIETPKQPTILFDIGGYFSELTTIKDLSIIGIIEDTENGYQKYLKNNTVLKYPVISVARSPLKQNEDHLVGESIVHAADSILRLENILIEYSQCAIIGYGKVGAGISSGLLKKNIKPFVVEKNPIRLLTAVNNCCYPSSLDKALLESKIIFCATGTKSLSIDDFKKLKNGAYIVSVTSSDDEFNLNDLESEYVATEISDKITKYTGNQNYFYLLNHGNAINFLFNGSPGPFIHLVQAEMLTAMTDLIDNKKKSKGIIKKKTDDRTIIAKQWLEEFTSIK